MNQLVLGLDLGTTNLKAILVDRSGVVVGLATRRFECDHPSDGIVEMPANRFLDIVRDAIGEALQKANATCDSIGGLSWASQANTFLLADASSRPLTPFIVWTDKRAAPLDEETLAFLSSDDFLEHTGFRLPVSELVVPKLRWIARAQPGIWRDAKRYFSLSDYLAWTLTGERIGDQGTASLVGLWSQTDEHWWGASLDFIERDAGFFGEMLRPGSRAGTVCSHGARVLGLSEGTIVATGSLDHHAAAWGAGIANIAPCSESTGTVVACLRLIGKRTTSPDYFLGPDVNPGHWYAAAFSAHGARELERCRDVHVTRYGMDEMVALAADAPPNGCFARFTNGGTGVVFDGDTSHPGARARAVMAAVAIELKQLVEQLHHGRMPSGVVATGGGAASDLWLKMKASTLGLPFYRSSSVRPAAYGAALFAATSLGWFNSAGEASSAWIRETDNFLPDND